MSDPLRTPSGLYKVLAIPPGNVKDRFDRQRMTMAVVHNNLIRGMNSMVFYAEKVRSQAEISSFIKYSLAFALILKHHHDNEEEVYFPELEKKLGAGTLEGNVSGHQGFHTTFDEWYEHCRSLSKDPSKFDSKRFIGGIEGYAPALINHLDEEITTLDPKVLRKCMSEEDLATVDRIMEKRIRAEASLSIDLPFVLVNSHAQSEGWMVSLPVWLVGFVRWILMPWNRDVWKFGTSDCYSNLKPEFAELVPQ